MNERKLYFEEVTERYAGIVIGSNIREASQEEITEARNLHNQGKCPHTIVYDEYGYMYDCRTCHTCGAPLGTV